MLILALISVISVLGGSIGCSSAQAPALDPDSPELNIFAPLPEIMASEKNPLTEEKIALGRMLYYDPRLSLGQDISCNTCHLLDKYGVDNEPTSDGHNGQEGDRNSPTVYNAAGHFVQFWDGRAVDVEEQAKAPVLNSVEMAMPSEEHVLKLLESMPGYVEAFKAAFPEEDQPVTYDNMALAIGAFERKLVTPSRWDMFLKGDATALTGAEIAGLNEFLNAGCQSCHMGAYLGGSMYQKLGLFKPWPDTTDTGRHQVTGAEADRMMFKVPSLHNIAMTAPYFHDGDIASLSEAVSRMAEYELGQELTEAQIDSISNWLNALTGEIPADYIREPELPPSTATTPEPELGN